MKSPILFIKRYPLAIIIFISVLIRISAAIFLGNDVEILPGTFDQLSYHHLALRVINGYGFTFGEVWWPITKADAPTAHWSFLYTLYLAFVYKIFGPNPLIARIIQSVIVGILLPLLTFKLGKFLFTEKVGLVAAGISAIYIYFVYYAGTLMTESFYILAILTSLYLAMRLVKINQGEDAKAKYRYAILLGITLGMAALLRQLIILFIPFVFLWVWWSGRKTGRKSLIPDLAVVGIIIGLLILPFTVYNYLRFDRFVLLNTNAGYAFFWGNHPIYGTHFESILPPEMGTYQELIPDELHHLDEAALDQELLGIGIQFILEDIQRYVLLSLCRIPPYFMFWPSPDSSAISNFSRVFSFGIFWPFMLLGLIYAPFSKFLKQKLRLEAPLMLIYLFIIIYAAIHILTWTLIRYRLPIDAVTVIFAAMIIIYITEFFSSRLQSKTRRSHLKTS